MQDSPAQRNAEETASTSVVAEGEAGSASVETPSRGGTGEGFKEPEKEESKKNTPAEPAPPIKPFFVYELPWDCLQCEHINTKQLYECYRCSFDRRMLEDDSVNESVLQDAREGKHLQEQPRKAPPPFREHDWVG